MKNNWRGLSLGAGPYESDTCHHSLCHVASDAYILTCPNSISLNKFNTRSASLLQLPEPFTTSRILEDPTSFRASTSWGETPGECRSPSQMCLEQSCELGRVLKLAATAQDREQRGGALAAFLETPGPATGAAHPNPHSPRLPLHQLRLPERLVQKTPPFPRRSGKLALVSFFHSAWASSCQAAPGIFLHPPMLSSWSVWGLSKALGRERVAQGLSFRSSRGGTGRERGLRGCSERLGLELKCF